MVYLQVVFVALLSFLIHRYARSLLNYRAACKIGLPIVILPTNWQDPLWILIEKKFAILQYLPFLGSWYQYSFLGWNLKDRYAAHERLGRTFIHVTPNRNEIWLSESTNIYKVIGKYKKWFRPKDLNGIFEIFGPNVNTVNGDQWHKHRKTVTHTLVEDNMSVVWDGATTQAEQWIQILHSRRNL